MEYKKETRGGKKVRAKKYILKISSAHLPAAFSQTDEFIHLSIYLSSNNFQKLHGGKDRVNVINRTNTKNKCLKVFLFNVKVFQDNIRSFSRLTILFSKWLFHPLTTTTQLSYQVTAF